MMFFTHLVVFSFVNHKWNLAHLLFVVSLFIQNKYSFNSRLALSLIFPRAQCSSCNSRFFCCPVRTKISSLASSRLLFKMYSDVDKWPVVWCDWNNERWSTHSIQNWMSIDLQLEIFSNKNRICMLHVTRTRQMRKTVNIVIAVKSAHTQYITWCMESLIARVNCHNYFAFYILNNFFSSFYAILWHHAVMYRYCDSNIIIFVNVVHVLRWLN